ncbi:MAG: TetR/AcrR family transcriptional regulator [Halofilum sp. (in: g-proteobacteria)]
MSEPPPNPGGPQRSAGRDEILAAATDLFGESGYDGVSMSAIAQRAGISKANVFHHFGSKDALYLEVMRAARAYFEPGTERLIEQNQDFGEQLRELIGRDFARMREHPDLARLILREILESGPSRGQALASEVFGEHFAELTGLFEQAQRQGGLARDIPPALIATLAIACNTMLFQSQHLLRHLPGVDFVDDGERYATLVARVLLDGLRDEQKDAEGESDA